MTEPVDETRAKRKARKGTAPLLCAIVALGLALRLYRLGVQSAWYDEVITLGFLNAPDLPHFFQAWRFTNWNAVPIYYVLEYFWGNFISDSVLGLRILSIFFGMAAIPLIFDFGRRLYGRRAGLVAALCLALSSVHIFQAQEIRNYSLTMLTALFCAYTFFLLIDRPSPGRFALHCLGIQLLVWTHLFGCYLLIALGAFLILFRWRQWRLTVPWFIINGLLMIPSVLWIRTFEPIQYFSPPTPRLWMMVNNSFTDVWSPTLVISLFPGRTWQIARTPLTDFFENTYLLADRITLVVFVASVVFLAFAAWRAARAAQKSEASQGKGASPLERFGFLFLWLFLPSIILFALARLWRTDVLSPKYTVYCSLAAYLILGGAVERLRRPGLMAVAAVIILTLFAHRYGAAVTHPQRPDWNGAAASIAKAHEPSDKALVYPGWLSVVAEYHLRDLDMPLTQADDLAAVCRQTEELLEPGSTLWVLCPIGYGNAEAMDRFGAYLRHRGIPFELENYWGGMRCIFVFRIPCPEGFQAVSGVELEAAIEFATVNWSPRNDGASAAQPVPGK